MTVKLLTEHHFEFLSLKGGCTGSVESTPVKMPHCWKPHGAAQIFNVLASLCRRADWFENYFARKPKDMFSSKKAHIKAMETKDKVHSVSPEATLPNEHSH